MLRLCTVCIIIFLIILAVGAFNMYLAGIQQSTSVPTPPKNIDTLKLRLDEQQITYESKKEADRVMDSYDDQMRRFRQMDPKPRATRF